MILLALAMAKRRFTLTYLLRILKINGLATSLHLGLMPIGNGSIVSLYHL